MSARIVASKILKDGLLKVDSNLKAGAYKYCAQIKKIELEKEQIELGKTLLKIVPN